MSDRRARRAARLAAQRTRNLEASRDWDLMGGPPPRDPLGRAADRHPWAVGGLVGAFLLLFVATALGFAVVAAVPHSSPAATTSTRP